MAAYRDACLSAAAWPHRQPADDPRDVRLALGELSSSPWIQYGITILTGKALPGQRPLIRHTVWSRLAGTVLSLALSVAGSVWLLLHGPLGWPLLLFTLAWTAGAARAMMMTILHHMAHGNSSGSHAPDRLLFEVLAVPLLLGDFDSYYHSHVVGHHGRSTGTVNDPEAYVLMVGFRPGTPRAQLWRRLALNAVSPKFHARMLLLRLHGCLLQPRRWQRRAAAWITHLGILAAAWTQGFLPVYGIAYLFPVLILYNISALLQFTSEHRWFDRGSRKMSRREQLAWMTFGRFAGDAPPARTAGLPAWLRFWARMLFLHLPTRLFVWVADMPQHDAHHRHPGHFDWANAEFARQSDLDRGCPGWPTPYTEVWGLGSALAEAFRAISEA